MISLSPLIWELLLGHVQSKTDHSGISKYDCSVTFYPQFDCLHSHHHLKSKCTGRNLTFSYSLSTMTVISRYKSRRLHQEARATRTKWNEKERFGGGGCGGGGSTTHLVIPAWWMAKPYGSRSFSSWFWNRQSIKLHITSTPALYRSSKWALQQ